MKIYIPAKDAIEILEKKLQELFAFDFNAEAWKAATANELKEIFSPVSMQWLQISHIQFDTYIDRDKATTLQKGRDTANKLLRSYIESIKKHAEIAAKKEASAYDNLQQEYHKLQDAYLADGRKSLADSQEHLNTLKEYNTLLDNYNEQSQEVENLENELTRFKENTVQWDDIRIGKVLRHLTWKQLTTIVALFAAIGGFGWWLGSTIERNNNRVEVYDYQTQRDADKKAIEKLEELSKKMDDSVAYYRQLVNQRKQTLGKDSLK
jgi:hypothetical protein